MIVQDLYLEKYNWNVRLYYYVDRYYIKDIINDLDKLKCGYKDLKNAYKLLNEDKLDKGITFSDLSSKSSVIVVSKASSVEEFANSLSHELFHLVIDISKTLSLDIYGEESAYLMGDITSRTFPVYKQFLID